MEKSAIVDKKGAIRTSPVRYIDVSDQAREGREAGPKFLLDMVQRSACMGCGPSLQMVTGRMASMPGAQRWATALSLQRRLGNRFVQRAAMQAKMAAGSDDHDTPERATLQRQTEPEEDEETLQGKFMPMQCKSEDEGDHPKAEFNRTGLPDVLKAGVEQLSGLSLDDVRVHYNSSRPADLQALAYTQGTDIHVAPGQERHLPHEAWHVVQQGQGRVWPTMQLQGVGVNDDVGLEREADLMGGRALQRQRENAGMRDRTSPYRAQMKPPLTPHPSAAAYGGDLMQRRMWDNIPVKFQTENGLGAPNSEYSVSVAGYRRFAPVNILRNYLDQVYLVSTDRSFLYVTGMPDDPNATQWNAAFVGPRVFSIVGRDVTIISETEFAPPLLASMEPTEGAVPYDTNVDHNGRINPDTVHVGHSITKVGALLPTLDDPETLQETLRQLESGVRSPQTEANKAAAKKLTKNPYI